MAQFECDECGVFFDDNDLVNCPNLMHLLERFN